MDSEAKIHQNSALGVLEGLVRPWIELVEELAKARKPVSNREVKCTPLMVVLRTLCQHVYLLVTDW